MIYLSTGTYFQSFLDSPKLYFSPAFEAELSSLCESSSLKLLFQIVCRSGRTLSRRLYIPSQTVNRDSKDESEHGEIIKASLCGNPVCIRARVPNSTALCQLGSTKMKTCSACRLIHYCSKSCQLKHWQAHKSVCKARTSSELEGRGLLNSLSQVVEESSLEVIRRLIDSMQQRILSCISASSPDQKVLSLSDENFWVVITVPRYSCNRLKRVLREGLILQALEDCGTSLILRWGSLHGQPLPEIESKFLASQDTLCFSLKIMVIPVCWLQP